MDISTQVQGETPSGGSKMFAVIVKVSGGQSFTVQVPSSATIGDIKALAESSSKIPRSAQRLFFKGKVLSDSDVLADKGIPSTATLFLVKASSATLPDEPAAEPAGAPETPSVQCLGKCGFFGSPALENYCSKCHKDKKDREAKEADDLKAKLEAEREAALRPVENADEREDQCDKSRCWNCNKKIGLTGVRCRCGYVFCAAHRYAESHECDYDYKTNERKKLTRQNPVVQADKLSEKA